MPHRILLLDDYPPTAEGFRAAIERSPDLEVAGHVSTSGKALASLALTQPDLILAGSDGLELVTQVRETHPALPVLLVASLPDDHHDQHAARAIRAGARGYLARSSSPEAVLAAIRSVLLGHVVLPESVARLLNASDGVDLSVESLSRRQLDVLRRIGQGMTTAETAADLGISPKTVETHRAHIKSKLNLDTANALIRWAALWVESERPHQADAPPAKANGAP
ncbi:MAG: response regulator transcription factor [Rubricoccaceae bacterium]